MIARRAVPWFLVLIAVSALLAILIPRGAVAAVDDDGDKIVNTVDKCPNTPKGESVDELGCSASQDADHDKVRDGTDKCPATPAEVTVDSVGCSKKESPKPPPSCTPNKAIAAAFGVKQDDLLVGSKVDWSLAPEAQPMNAFSGHELSSKGKLKSYLGGDGNDSSEARDLLKDALSNKQFTRAKAGTGWTPVQLRDGKTAKLKGNYQLIGGDVKKRASTSQPFEVFWVYVPDSCDGSKVAISVAIRAWCGNPILFVGD